MKVHVIIDFMHIYYKYFFQLRAGKLKKLSAPLNWNGTVIEKDTTLIYYPLKDIESIRKNMECLGHQVTVSVCFDSKSFKKDETGGEEYKSGRPNNLTTENYKDIDFIKNLLSEAGHNVYKEEGYEADDIVNNLAATYKNKFEYTVIYTNDKDLLINICDNVGVMRYKQYTGYEQVSKDNYEVYLEKEFGVFIPYNAIGLYLASAGDSADKIKGISKFGPKAFSKLITKIAAKNKVDWASCTSYTEAQKVIVMCEEFLTAEQFNQLKESFVLVANLEMIEELEEPVKVSTQELREKAYLEYKMVSLIF